MKIITFKLALLLALISFTFSFERRNTNFDGESEDAGIGMSKGLKCKFKKLNLDFITNELPLLKEKLEEMTKSKNNFGKKNASKFQKEKKKVEKKIEKVSSKINRKQEEIKDLKCEENHHKNKKEGKRRYHF